MTSKDSLGFGNALIRASGSIQDLSAKSVRTITCMGIDVSHGN